MHAFQPCKRPIIKAAVEQLVYEEGAGVLWSNIDGLPAASWMLFIQLQRMGGCLQIGVQFGGLNQERRVFLLLFLTVIIQ